jgi:hypothetical protein
MKTDELSDRLRHTLRTYCLEMDDALVEDLGSDVRSGALDWFPAEFEDAIASEKFTPHNWGEATLVAIDDDDLDQLDEYLRQVWSQVAPGRPFPGQHAG